MKELIVASSNANKIREFKEMLTPLGYCVKGLSDLDVQITIVEDGETFQENAYKKAKTVYDVLHCEVISDDSGICINAMGGRPGVKSARFLGESTSYEYKNNYILEEIKDAEDRRARYVCAICHIDADGKANTYTGECLGEIANEPRGEGGFGYDPIFYYPPYHTTLANVSDAEKNLISHRAKALNMLLEGMKQHD